jgi:predicted HD phosphohydrolase
VKTITAIAANKLGKFLAKDFRRVFGPAHDDMAERLGALARSTIECLARSDALYHNYEHTLQVTMVGRDILQGMTLSQRIEPTDYSHLIIACLLHDIGYMRGVLSGDTETEFVVDGSGKKSRYPAAHQMQPSYLITSTGRSCLPLSASEIHPLSMRLVSQPQLR